MSKSIMSRRNVLQAGADSTAGKRAALHLVMSP